MTIFRGNTVSSRKYKPFKSKTKKGKIDFQAIALPESKGIKMGIMK